jgi:hypothetical protein
MDTQKLLRIARELLDEAQEDQISDHLSSLVNHLSQGTTASYAAAEEVRSTLNESYERSYINEYTPSYHEIASELGSGMYFGKGAQLHLNNIFESSRLDLVSELTNYQTQFTEHISKLNALVGSLDSIGIEAYQNEGFEVGYIIPIELNSVQEVTKHLKLYESFLKIAAEIAGEDYTEIRITRVSNGTLEFFIACGVGVAKIVDTVLKRILSLYKEVEEIKEISARIDNLNANTTKTKVETLGMLLKLEKEYKENYVDSTVKEVMQEYKGSAERKDELDGDLGVAAKLVLADIQKGIKVEVNAPETTDEAVDKATNKVVEKIAERNVDLQNLYLKSKEELALPFKVSPTAKELEKLTKDKSDSKKDVNKKSENKSPKNTQ